MRTVLNIGVPRTGTVYLENSLFPVYPRHHYVFYNKTPGWELASFTYADLADFPDAYVVGFTRNPFDLLWSHYGLIQRYDAMFHHYDAKLAMLDFRDYVTLVTHRRQLYPQRLPLFFQLFTGVGKLVPHYLGRYETLDQDLENIASISGVKYTSQPAMNASLHGDYRDAYDDAMYDMVEEAYLGDFQYFGYNRDGYTDSKFVTYGEQ